MIIFFLGSIAIHCLSSTFFCHCGWKFNCQKSLGVPRFKPGMVGCEPQTLPLCYAVPPPRNMFMTGLWRLCCRTIIWLTSDKKNFDTMLSLTGFLFKVKFIGQYFIFNQFTPSSCTDPGNHPKFNIKRSKPYFFKVYFTLKVSILFIFDASRAMGTLWDTICQFYYYGEIALINLPNNYLCV